MISQISVGVRVLSKSGSRYVVSIPKNVAEHLLRQGVRYVEVYVKPIDLKPKGEPDKTVEKRAGDQAM